jgi:hypothetical protein
MKVMERRVLELEDSLNSFRESNMERLVGLESLKRGHSRRGHSRRKKRTQ